MPNMTKERAYALLGISRISGEAFATPDEIKTQYRIYALKYHPDKNKDANATAKFREIQEAYEYLTSHRESEDMMDYKTMIGSFLSNVFFQTEPAPDLKTELCRMIVSNILGLCEKKALEYIEKIDKTTLAKIHVILEKYRDAFHISDAIFAKLNEILSKTTECVLLNPFLEDLMEDNLYKITENGNTFIVPLWHHELVYDNSGEDFLVRCCPVLPENMEIDEDNNVYVYLTYRLSELWGKDRMSVSFGKTTLEFLTIHLCLSEHPQTIRLRNKGISHIHPENMFDNSVRKDVLLIITITGL